MSPGVVCEEGFRVENSWKQGTDRDQTKALKSPGSKRHLLVSIQHPSKSPVITHGEGVGGWRRASNPKTD